MSDFFIKSFNLLFRPLSSGSFIFSVLFFTVVLISVCYAFFVLRKL